MPTGRVKWYDKNKGYGFIESPEGDVFFHFSDIQMEGFRALAEDQRVSYRAVQTPRGLKAREVQPLDRRASVRSAARYRTLVLMKIRPGQEEAFDRLLGGLPAWLDSFEQEVGLRNVGTWRSGSDAVRLVESERPYEQALRLAEDHERYSEYARWREQLLELLTDSPQVMKAVLPPDEAPEG